MMPVSIVVEPASVTGQQTFYGEVFPLVLQCRTSQPSLSAVVEWLGDNRDELKHLSAKHGAVLFRGFPLASPEDFDAFVAAFGLPNFPYNESLSNAVRVNWTERVFSANEAPPKSRSTCTTRWRRRRSFRPIVFLLPAAGRGGRRNADVPIRRLVRAAGRALSAVRARLRRKRTAIHERDAVGERSEIRHGPQLAEHAAGRRRAKKRKSGCASINYSWEWLADGCLRATTPVLPAVRKLSTGRKTFFNQLIAAFHGWKDSRNDPAKAIRFRRRHAARSRRRQDGHGTGRRVDVRRALAARRRGASWTTIVTMHGRRTFRGTRKVLASLVSPQTHANRNDE